MTINLKQAREQGKLEKFIKEREAENAPKGDARAFDKTVKSMAGKSEEARPASQSDCSDD
jgi:hypothetical protein